MSKQTMQDLLTAKGVITDDEVSFSVILDKISALVKTDKDKWIDCARERFIILSQLDFVKLT